MPQSSPGIPGALTALHRRDSSFSSLPLEFQGQGNVRRVRRQCRVAGTLTHRKRFQGAEWRSNLARFLRTLEKKG